EQYRAARTRVETLRRREQELLVQFLPESTRVREVREMLTAAEEEVAKLEAEQPALTRMGITPTPATGRPAAAGMDADSDRSRLIALESRIKALNAQREEIRTEANNLDQLELGIRELRRRQQLEEANYGY